MFPYIYDASTIDFLEVPISLNMMATPCKEVEQGGQSEVEVDVVRYEHYSPYTLISDVDIPRFNSDTQVFYYLNGTIIE